MEDLAKGTLVSYTVSYGGRPGQPDHRTEYGRVTRTRTGGSRRLPRVTIAVISPRPGEAKYVERYRDDISATPLHDALARVDRAQSAARSQMPNGELGDFPLPAELNALRQLAEVVRMTGTGKA